MPDLSVPEVQPHNSRHSTERALDRNKGTMSRLRSLIMVSLQMKFLRREIRIRSWIVPTPGNPYSELDSSYAGKSVFGVGLFEC
jgi:hypothetical protein